MLSSETCTRTKTTQSYIIGTLVHEAPWTCNPAPLRHNMLNSTCLSEPIKSSGPKLLAFPWWTRPILRQDSSPFIYH